MEPSPWISPTLSAWVFIHQPCYLSVFSLWVLYPNIIGDHPQKDLTLIDDNCSHCRINIFYKSFYIFGNCFSNFFEKWFKKTKTSFIFIFLVSWIFFCHHARKLLKKKSSLWMKKIIQKIYLSLGNGFSSLITHS